MIKFKKNTQRLLLTGLLTASSFAPSFAEESNKLNLTADNFNYSENGNTVRAQGNVQIISEKGSIWADTLSYFKKSGKIIASGNVVYVNENNITSFVESIELSDGMKAGVMKNLYMKLGVDSDTYKAPIVAAEKAERHDRDNMTLTNVAYSPCPLCANEKDDDLAWKIRAGEMAYNDAKGHMTYTDAYLDVYGTPVMYLPWFRHPVKDVAVNGMLPPMFGNSTSKGFKVSNAYYHRISPNFDTTTRVNYYTERGVQLQPELRYQGDNLYTELRTSYINDEKTSRNRSHFESKTEYIAEKGLRYGFVGEIASDDDYLDDFYEKTDAYLGMQAYVEDASETHYSALSATRYQDLRAEAKNEQTPHTLPRFEFEHIFRKDNDPSKYWMIDGDAMSLTRRQGGAIQRFASSISYNQTNLTDAGNRFTFKAGVRADLYNINVEEDNTTAEDGFAFRMLPQMSLMWDRSYISAEGTHKVTPKAMLVVSPLGSNPREISNEDSLDYEISAYNLFKANRFSGYDRVESGSRFIYGIDNHWGSAENIDWRLFLGQSLRLNTDTAIKEATNDDRNQSDFVGIFEGTPTDWLTFRSNFLLDQSTFNAERMDNSVTLGNRDASYLEATHTYVKEGPEELNLKGRHKLNDTWAVEGQLRKDLDDDGRTLVSSGSVVYTEDCYRFSFRAQRRGYESSDVDPATEYTFNVELLTFGNK